MKTAIIILLVLQCTFTGLAQKQGADARYGNRTMFRLGLSPAVIERNYVTGGYISIGFFVLTRDPGSNIQRNSSE